MKAYLFKRGTAFFIDILSIGVFYVVCCVCMAEIFMEVNVGEFLFIISPIFFRDIFFKNASIGKKIMGLVVVDDKWKAPKFWHGVKRSTVTYFAADIKMHIIRNYSGNYLDFWDWERDKLKAFVVEKCVLDRLKNDPATQNGLNCEKMTSMYREHLLSIIQ